MQGRKKPGAEVVAKADWVITKAVENKKAVENLKKAFHLGQGEAEAIILAEQLRADWIIIDEPRARKAAAKIKQKVIGTIGIALLAKHFDLVKSVRDLLDELIQAGFRLSERTYKKVLYQAGEAED